MIDVDSITVTLTQIGYSQDLIVESIDWGKKVKIKSGNASKIDCYYVIQAARIDGEPLIVEYEGETPAEAISGDDRQFSISGYNYDARGDGTGGKEMTNPFESFQSTTGGRAGFSAYKELTEDKAFDDETLQDNPGTPFTIQFLENESPEFSRDVDIPNYEEEQRQKFKDLKKTVGNIDSDFETRFITPINEKKAQIVTIIGDVFESAYGTGSPTQNLLGNTNPRLLSDLGTFVIPDDYGENQVINREEVGITTFVYGTLTGAGTTSVIGIKGTVYKDILLAYQYHNLTNSESSSLLPLVDQFIVEYHHRVCSCIQCIKTLQAKQSWYRSNCHRHWRYNRWVCNYFSLYTIIWCIAW